MPWSCAFRSTFRLEPEPGRERDYLAVLLESDGKTQEEILAALPYHKERALTPGELPDAKRYRDNRQLFRTVGLLYADSPGPTHRLKVTALGRAVARWRPVINPRNMPVLGRHAAQALAACQLRNPLRESRGYGEEVEVFPFAFIWRAMLALDGTISSEELNRALFRTHNADQLADAIARIRRYRTTGDTADLGPETATGEMKNDRILVWMGWASFGWTLIRDKKTSGTKTYSVVPKARRLLMDAAAIRHRHREFADEGSYVEHLSACAGLPEDLR